MEFIGRKIGFDYDGTLSTSAIKEIAKKYVERGDNVYIVSARRYVSASMLSVARDLGIMITRVHAVGSTQAKIDKVLELGLNIFYDNNPKVLSELRLKGINTKKT